MTDYQRLTEAQKTQMRADTAEVTWPDGRMFLVGTAPHQWGEDDPRWYYDFDWAAWAETKYTLHGDGLITTDAPDVISWLVQAERKG